MYAKKRPRVQMSQTSVPLSPLSQSVSAPAPAAPHDDRAMIKQRLASKKEISARLEEIGVELLHLSPRKAAALAAEYLRFMHLKTVLDIGDQPSTLAPSYDIDEVWHKHVSDTRSYKMMESLLLPPGQYIHHNPFTKEQPGYPERLENTVLHYQNRFDAKPPSYIWGGGGAEEEVLVKEEEGMARLKADNMAVSALDDARVSFKLKTLTGNEFHFYSLKSESIRQLKIRIKNGLGIATNQMRLMYADEQMEDNRRLVDYNIHLTLRLGGC